MSRSLAALLGAVCGAAAVGLRPLRVEVAGTSMVPALLPGDRLLALRQPRYGIGDLVVVGDPRDPARLLVKRLAALPGSRISASGVTIEAGADEVVLLGDNPDASTDSREIGPVRLADLRGRCVYRYAPADRVGRLPAV
jgi:signal peptidase I